MKKRLLNRYLAVILATVILVAAVPGSLFSASAAENTISQENVLEEELSDAEENAEEVLRDTEVVGNETEDLTEAAEVDESDSGTADPDVLSEVKDPTDADSVNPETQNGEDNEAADPLEEEILTEGDLIKEEVLTEDDSIEEELPAEDDLIVEEAPIEDDLIMEEDNTGANQAVTPTYSLDDAVISGIKDMTYTGNNVTLNLTVKVGSVTLKAGTDYMVSYSNNTEVGEATVTITGISSCTGIVTRKFLILPGASKKVTAKNVASGISLRWEKVDGATYYHVYRGNVLIAETSKLECVDKGVVNNIGKKYTYKVIASKSKKWFSTKARTATMYRLRPVGITSLTSTEPGKMTVKYDSGEVCTGYVVRYGLKADMSDAKVISVQGVGTIQKTFNNLTKGKTYYVQVRTYINENGIRYYSGYSYTKTVKIIVTEPVIPKITLTNVPAYGTYGNLKGKVFMSDGSALNTSKYRISVLIQISKNGPYWPKPTFDNPYTKLNGDGSFVVDYTTGGYDQLAEVLHVMLLPTSVKIPSSVMYDNSFELIKAKAIYYVRIDRAENGKNMISYP